MRNVSKFVPIFNCLHNNVPFVGVKKPKDEFFKVRNLSMRSRTNLISTIFAWKSKHCIFCYDVNWCDGPSSLPLFMLTIHSDTPLFQPPKQMVAIFFI